MVIVWSSYMVNQDNPKYSKECSPESATTDPSFFWIDCIFITDLEVFTLKIRVFLSWYTLPHKVKTLLIDGVWFLYDSVPETYTHYKQVRLDSLSVLAKYQGYLLHKILQN